MAAMPLIGRLAAVVCLYSAPVKVYFETYLKQERYL
jgi:hypothetical protein